MKPISLSIAKRLILTVSIVICLCGIGFGIVIHSLYNVEKVIKSESSEHIDLLTVNSVISRQVFELTTRVQLLEQAILYSESTLFEEGFNIDQQLQKMRELSSNRVFSEKMDLFIENFHRFLGNSLTLNRIIREMNTLDHDLEVELDKLDFLVADSKIDIIFSDNSLREDNNLGVIDMMRESFLTIGKQVGTIRSHITPETEKVVIIEVQKELDIFQLHLDNLASDDEQVQVQKRKIKRVLIKFHASLRKMKANLDQRWIVMASLVKSQNELLNLVQQTEYDVQQSALELSKGLEKEISNSRFDVFIIACLATLLGLFLTTRLVRKHIRDPLEALRHGFMNLETSSFHERVALGRSDEWSLIEKAFNKMASQLEESYSELNEEKRNFDFLAHHDPLTGLANRLLIMKKLNELIASSKGTENAFVVLYLDVDEFKTINDSLGHAVGDQLLKDVAQTLVCIIGEKGIVARMGGDEFMIVMSNVATISEGAAIAEEINCHVRKPYQLDNKTVFVSGSIGLCQFPENGSDGETLIRNADTAMYHAKRRGRDQTCIYTDSMTLEANDRIELSAGLHQALESEQFELVFQPQVNLETQTIFGAEALIRWNHPTYGILTPGEFLHIAEQVGLLVDIDDWIFNRMVSYISQWKAAGYDLSEFIFSVNFSARKFFTDDLSHQLMETLEGTSCLPSQFALEITERDMMSGPDNSTDSIHRLRKNGFRIAIDDFGTGNSSLALLKRLSVDVVKLDQTFIENITHSHRDSTIVKAIIDLTHELNLDVIAEGVECDEQVNALIEMGCQMAQGYYFGQPLSEREWLNLVQDNQFKKQ